MDKLLVIVGETASGKSDLALQLAQKLNGEIICADSWTVRRELNIGTAKPSPEDQAKIKHHLVDIVGPDEEFTAAVFKKLAEQAITEIKSRGKLPIMVGGAGLYIDGVIYDYSFLEAGDRGVRLELNNLTADQLVERVQELGFDLEGIDTRNKRRLIRLLETNGARPTKKQLRPDTILVGLTTDREKLNKKIISRVDNMLAAGLEAEVKGLSDKYGWEAEGLKGVDYAQWRDYFLGTQTLPETRQKIIKATLDLAKKQRTWFKRNNSIHWFSAPVNLTVIVEFITTQLTK